MLTRCPHSQQPLQRLDPQKDKVGREDGIACTPQVWLEPLLLFDKAEWLAKHLQRCDVRGEAAHCILDVEDCPAGEYLVSKVLCEGMHLRFQLRQLDHGELLPEGFASDAV